MINSDIQKLLFVCSQNRFRSLTAERIYDGFPGYQVRSAGTQPDARIVVTAGHIGWADIVFCMEKSHLNRLRRKFPDALRGKRVICLHIPDEFEFMDPALIEQLRARLGPYVAVPGGKPEPGAVTMASQRRGLEARKRRRKPARARSPHFDD